MFDRPVIINAFSRGGSNIVWNLLLSHPRFITPLVETHQMFLGLSAAEGFWRNLKFDMRHGQMSFQPWYSHGHLFRNFGCLSPSNYSNRDLSKAFTNSLQGVIQEHARKIIDHPYLKFKNATDVYCADELSEARVSLKSINGSILLTPQLVRPFPNAVVIGLVRNGLALWEARSRRNNSMSPKKFGYLYRLTVEEMEAQAETLPNSEILQFERVFEDFDGFMVDLARLTEEDFSTLGSFRFKVKGHYDNSASYISPADPEAMIWVPREDLFNFLNPQTNDMQIDRVPKEDRDLFLVEARQVMERHGYLP